MDFRRRSLSVQSIGLPLDGKQRCTTDRTNKQNRKTVKPQVIASQQESPLIYQRKSLDALHGNNELEQFNDGHKIIKEGILYNSGSIFVTLTRTQLKEYTDKRILIRVISLSEFLFTVTQENQRIRIIFPNEKQSLLYQAKDAVDAKIWVTYLKVIEQRYHTYQRIKLQPKEISRYFGTDVISENTFVKIAETGDLLLFETNNTGAALQRMVCKSQFDHVAIALKVANKYLFVFDSNADTGVTIMEWNQFIEINDLYERVSIRKLGNINRMEIEKKIIHFLQLTHGKRYEVTLSKLFRKRSLSPSKPTDCYFCSELVAKAYKFSGLLTTDKASSSFWPVDFTKELQLNRGSYLNDAVTVILKKHYIID